MHWMQRTMLPLADLCSENARSIVFGAIVLYLGYSVRSWYRLRQFKGPWLAKHTRLWLLRKVSDNKLHVSFPELHKKYGKYDASSIDVHVCIRRWES